MSGWQDWIFGNLPQSPPPHPASRMDPSAARYAAMPTMTAPIEDRAQRGGGRLAVEAA